MTVIFEMGPSIVPREDIFTLILIKKKLRVDLEGPKKFMDLSKDVLEISQQNGKIKHVFYLSYFSLFTVWNGIACLDIFFCRRLSVTFAYAFKKFKESFMSFISSAVKVTSKGVLRNFLW